MSVKGDEQTFNFHLFPNVSLKILQLFVTFWSQFVCNLREKLIGILVVLYGFTLPAIVQTCSGNELLFKENNDEEKLVQNRCRLIALVPQTFDLLRH